MFLLIAVVAGWCPEIHPPAEPVLFPAIFEQFPADL
jgi:hypothetical protein